MSKNPPDGRSALPLSAAKIERGNSTPAWRPRSIVTDHIEHHLEEVVAPLPGAVRRDLTKLVELARYL